MVLPFSPWVMVALIGVIAVGLVIAYGVMQNHNRTAADRAASERGAQRIYERED